MTNNTSEIKFESNPKEMTENQIVLNTDGVKSEQKDFEKKINLNDDVDDVTIIVGSTNFFFNFKNTKEIIPVLLLFHEDEEFFGEEVINKLQEKKYLKESMIFFDFLYYLDKKYKTSKETLIKRNLYNKDLSFIEKKLDSLDIKEKVDYENKSQQIISFVFISYFR